MVDIRKISSDLKPIIDRIESKSYTTEDLLAWSFRISIWHDDAEYILNTKKKAVLNSLLRNDPTMSAHEQMVRVNGECAYEIKVCSRIANIIRAINKLLAKEE